MPDVASLQVRVTADTSAAERQLHDLGGQVASFGEAFRSGLGIGAGIEAARAGLELLTRGFGALKGSAVDFNQTIDGARATMGRFFTSNEALNNSIANLNDLAAKTPFAFEGLLTAQQRTIGAARSAQELKDNMDAIAVAAANTGHVSSTNVDRISLALGQMQAKGHLAGGEMLQLTEAGVNMGEILAHHFGVSTAAITKMVSEGKIGSQDVFAALRENAADPRNRQALDALAKTWEGALSTIGDVGRTLIAQTFRPLFDLMTEGAVAVADFLQSADFKAWAEAARAGFEALSNGIKGLLTGLAPLGQAIAEAFHQATQGDFSGALATLSAGVETQLGVIWESVTAFGSQMVGAGENVIHSFAEGMLSGGYDAITGAIDAITTFIADMLIGHSPPKSGPLSELDSGGANAAMAWAGPFGAVMQKEVASSVEGIKGGIAQLHDASRDVAGQIREITDQTQDLDRAIAGLRETIDDTKKAFAQTTQGVRDAAEATKATYAQAIQSVRDQIDSIKDSHQVAAEAVQKQIDDIKDKYGAAIDAVRASIDTIKERYDAAETAVQRQIDLVKDKYAGAVDELREKIARIKDDEVARLDPLQRQLALLENTNKLVRERQDAERAITNAKTQQLMLDALGDPKLRAQLAGQLAGVEAQQQQVDLAQQLAEAQAKLAAGGLSASEQRSLQLKIQQLEIQKKLADMVDTTRLAEATQQSELESSTEKQLTATRAIEDAHTRITEIPLKEKIDEIQQAAEAALRPLNAQLREVESAQKAALDPLQDKLRELKAAEADALVPLQSRLKQIERDQKAALDPLQDKLKEIKREEADALRPLESHLKDVQREAANADRVFDAMLSAIAQQQRDVLKPLDDQLTVYQHQKEALTEQRQELERIKAQLGEALQIQQEAERAAKEAAKNRPDTPGAPAGGIDFALDAKAQAAAEAAKSAGANLAQKLGEGFTSWWETNKTTVVERVIGAIAGGLIGGPIGALAGAAFLPQFIEKLQEKLRERGFDAKPFIDELTQDLNRQDYGKAAEAIAYGTARAVIATPAAVGRGIGRAIAEMFKPSATDTESVGTGIVKGILKAISDSFWSYIDEWARADERFAAATKRFFLAVTNAVRKQFGLGPEGGSSAEPSPVMQDVGDSLAAGIEDGIVKHDSIFTTISTYMQKIIDTVKRILGIASPSTVMQEIGVQTVDGLLLGITTKWDDLQTWWEELPGNIQTAFGWSGSGFTWVADLKTMGSKMLENIWEGLDDYWTQFSTWWTDLPKNIQTAFGWSGGAFTWAADLKTMGSTVLENIWGGLDAYWTQFSQWWQDLPGEIQKAFGWSGSALTWAADLKTMGMAVLEGLWSGLDAYWRDHLEPWWGDFKDAIFRAMGIGGAAIDWLKDAGRQVLQSFWDGLNELWGDEESPGTVKGLIKTITDWIPDFIKEALGVHSPSQVMHDLGHNTMQGLINGLRSRFPDLQTTVKEAMSHLSGGLGRIRFPGGDLGDDGLDAIMQAATSLAGVSSDWIDGLRWIAQHESGGDPYAVNPQEVGNGEHASGLMQTIPSTFAAYRSRDLPDDIFNPLANAVAAIRYIKDTYDGDLNWVIEHWAERGGYAEGGWAGLHGPELAWLGERGPEYIIPNHALAGGVGAGAPAMQTIRLDVALDGQVKQRLWIEGYQLLARRGGLPGRFGDFA